MVYASRSGSTVLSKLLAENLEDLAVTPELKFDVLFKLSSRWLATASGCEIWAKIAKAGRLRNLEVARDAVVAQLDAMEKTKTVATVLEKIVELHLRETGKNEVSSVIIKCGPHAFVWHHIIEHFPEARFIFVTRDPRAVVSSQLRTVRPYYSFEPMAWEGAWLAAYRWTMYSRVMRRVYERGIPVLDIRYEDLLDDADGQIDSVGEFVECNRNAGPKMDSYEIPRTEKGIHTLVQSSGLVASRRDGWRRELSDFKRKTVESVAFCEMGARGYSSDDRWGNMARLWMSWLNAPLTAYLVGRHFLLKALKGTVELEEKIDE